MSYYEYHVAKRYVQFEGALEELPRYAALIGKKILVITACVPVYDLVLDKIKRGIGKTSAELLQADLLESSPRYASYKGMSETLDEVRRETVYGFYDIGDMVVSESNVRRVAEMVKEEGYDTVVGIGGGKGMDFARAITHFTPVKVILVPTLCATNASISTLSVIYDDTGRTIREYWRMNNAPELVLADTEILVKNGPKILAAGIGDIVSTYYEGICNVRMAGLEDRFADLSYEGIKMGVEIMKKKGPLAIEAAKRGEITPEFESIVSMILHNPGPMWTICTLGFAHVLDEVFLYFDGVHSCMHGLRVGMAVQMMLGYTGAPEEEIRSYKEFLENVGIPTTLAEIGLTDVTKEMLEEAVENTIMKSGTLGSLPFEVTKEEIINILLKAE